MRVNQRVFTERIDMLDEIRIPNCPSQFKVIAENIINMASKLGYSVGSYNTMTELDKIIMWDYWREYDGLFKDEHDEIESRDIKDWFIHKATAPELIRRAREWLASHNYIIIRSDVQQRALDAGIKMSKAISH
jgi:hypothetical protein